MLFSKIPILLINLKSIVFSGFSLGIMLLIKVDKDIIRNKASENKKSYTAIHTFNNEGFLKKFILKIIYWESKLLITFFLIFFMNYQPMFAQDNFLATQLTYQRVKQAYEEKFVLLSSNFKEQGLSFPPKEIYFRAFKEEGDLEVWVKNGNSFVLFKTYSICKKSGELGPKSKEGDLQVPEGFYHIDRFNSNSNFWLSLGINYPNQADKNRSNATSLGGDIFIHGSCVTVGCLPMTDNYIKEIYLLAVLAKNHGQAKIPVHIFPYRFSFFKDIYYKNSNDNINLFWDNIKQEYLYFNEFKTLRKFEYLSNGFYRFY